MTADAARRLHEMGQSLWLDNITRALLTTKTLASYIDDDSVTGLTSNPTIFDNAISGSADYDAQIRELLAAGHQGEDVFFALALQDLTAASTLFRPVWDRTSGVDGWVSLEVSPLLANDTESTIAEAVALHGRANVPNLFIKVPGTPEGIPAIEELIFRGIPINVTLLFSREHYLAAAGAYLRGLERRRDAGLELQVGSVASVFISRWDHATADKVPPAIKDRLGVAIAKRTYKSYRDLLDSDRWRALADAGAQPQRLLWASTGTKDPALPDTFYISELASDLTVNTMPEGTLQALADHGELGRELPADGGDAEQTIAAYGDAGINVDALGARLQLDGAKSFDDSWADLLRCIETKATALERSG